MGAIIGACMKKKQYKGNGNAYRDEVEAGQSYRKMERILRIAVTEHSSRGKWYMQRQKTGKQQ